ncbi:ACP S-malonyltransferase [Tichowtungia aerotolerans]|uniref:Malonyl CoA-acyl carrier protein transacylase n=1 Tax=Tichowtungia aerotolerans TaxID=2697043 RepID=A0A6P1M416_9BACT|nr:ACP S-malonyltransferase [Tichowtungia aerotolerans]QHI69589.1 ACP S-malonyltransferase [Tichowtungia aerotolerans]
MKRAILFPGQGSQSVGMGRDLYDAIPECKTLFDKANDVLGYDIAAICFDGPEDELKKSHNTQPAIFTVSAAAFEAMKIKKPTEFDFAAGHSLGEWGALYAAGVISFEDTLNVLKARGEFIQAACDANPGGMLAVIGLDGEPLEKIAAEAGVTMANINSPGQTVLSGTAEAIEKAAEACKEAGAKRALPLPVAGAFHSPLMQPAADQMAEMLADIEFSEPVMPVLSNVTGAPHESAAAIRANMVAQITGSVRWVECMQYLSAQGVTEAVECGPGKVLAGLMKRIDRNVAVSCIGTLADLDS